jgi:alpha-mannosidase
MFPELSLLKKPAVLARLRRVRKNIYTPLGKPSVAVATADEPFDGKGASFRPISRGSWGKAFTCGIFRVKGTLPKDADKNDLAIIADIGGEGQLYTPDGVPSIALTSRLITPLDLFQAHKGKTLIELADAIPKGDELDFYIDAGFNGASLIFSPYGKCRYKGVSIVKINKDVKAFYYDFLTLAYRTDEKPVASALRKAYSAYKRGAVKEARQILAPHLIDERKSDFKFYAVGHSHLDLAWLWPLREGRRKSVRTISNQLRHIERYPGFIYGASQPQQFEWAKESYPEFFQRIKNAVKDGRLEPQGAMWVEADTNVPSGEALVRQIAYGQGFWRENFGKTSKICWLPDVFGYNGNLPQILKKCGVPYFMTIKLSWNMFNKFPYHTFNWKGIDGSEVLVHMPPSGNYLGGGTPVCFKDAYNRYREKEVSDKALFLFGAGDGGGGPSEAQLEILSRQVKNKDGIVKFSSAEEFFEDLAKDKKKYPAFSGELYLEKHQATYTTQCKTKRFNRKLEFALHTAEYVNAMRARGGAKYPHELIDRTWKNLLLYQFHDIIPGSSIPRVYKETAESYSKMLAALDENISGKNPKYLLNPAPFARDEFLVENGKCLRFAAAPYSSALPVEVKEQSTDLKFTDDTIENDLIKATFDASGAIVSLIDKASGFENAKGALNDLRIYRDPYMYYSAWDLKANYVKKPTKGFRLVKAQTQIVGNVLIRTQVLKRGRSKIEQKITLCAGSPQITFENKATLNRVFRMLRADFAPAVWANEVTCDIQFGNIKRATTNDNSVERAQFEICAHKYVDLNDGARGFALLNDCKYGHRVKEGKISLNLVRNPIYPDPKADRGEQQFTYAILPYAGTLEKSDVVKNSYLLNLPPVKTSEKLDCPFDIEGGVVAETVKLGADNSLVLRLYEPYGKKAKAKIVPDFAYKEVKQADLLEDNLADTKLEVEFAPFEIKTFVFIG